MDQHFGKPPEKRRLLGHDSVKEREKADSTAPGEEKARRFTLINDGTLYDDPRNVSGSGGRDTLYDDLGTTSKSAAGARRSNAPSDRLAGGEGAKQTARSSSGIASKAEARGGDRLSGSEQAWRSQETEQEGAQNAGGTARSEPGPVDNGSAVYDRRGGQNKNSAASKGSCPSWLRSRLYKSGRPLEDSDRLLELHDQVIRHSPVGTAIFDNKGHVKMSNEAFSHVIGLGAEEGIRDIEQIGTRIRGVDLTEKFWDAVETGFDVKIEEQVHVEDRGKVTFRASFHPVTFASGMSWCICYFEDASHSGPPRGHIWEYQNYVTCVATSSGDAIVGLDLDGKIKYWNQGAQALFGYADDEIVGQPVMSLVPEELRREAQLVLKVVKEKGIYKNYDTYRLGKNGRRIPVTMTVAAVRDEDGELIGTAATIKDVGSTKDLHEKAMEAEKLNAMLQMAITVNHRINDPLCVIAANSQILLTRIGEADSEEGKKLVSILEATKKISAVLEDLGRLIGVEPQIDSSGKNKQSIPQSESS